MVQRLRVACSGLAVTAALLMSGCAPEPGPTPSPAAPSPSTNPTPDENAQERQQREDFEAAKAAYLESNAEMDRLMMSGGASKPTRVLLATTTGSYQTTLMNVLRMFEDKGWHSDREFPPAAVVAGGWSPTELNLTACEDGSKVRYIDKKGKEMLGDAERLYVHSLTAVRKGGTWKIATIDSKAVKSFAHENCGTGE